MRARVDDWRAVAELTEGPRAAVVVHPYFQGEALTRQRPKLVPQTSLAPTRLLGGESAVEADLRVLVER